MAAEGWDGDHDVEEITEEQLDEILACWDRLVTPDMAAGARLVDLQESDRHWATGEDAAGDSPNSELPDGDIFGPYRADDASMTPLGRLLYGQEPSPDPQEPADT